MGFSSELLEVLIKYVDEGIHVIDKDEKTILYNKVMEELEGMNGSEVIGRKILDVFPSLNENTSTLCSVLKSGEPIMDRYQNYVNKKGYNIATINTTIPIKIDNKVVGAVEISKDFTKVKELYDKIIDLRNKNKNNDDSITFTFDSISGYSFKFLNTVETAKKASKSPSTVLVYGETGTGKEVFARCIHNESDRRDKPFIAVNCAALPEGLLEGILFGTVKGGFTGAMNRPGLFEQANGGTLLLDEINSMSASLQAKLLRVLQEGYIRRIGDIKDIPVDSRIIATTNEEPIEAVKRGAIRKDLYYRLSVVNITIPPLRERKEDIPLFINEFVEKYNEAFSKEVWDISKEVYDSFLKYEWPGNVRELKNYVEGAMNMVTGHVLKKEAFTPQVQETIFDEDVMRASNLSREYEFEVPLDEYMNDIERNIIIKALLKCENNISEAARALNIKRQTLQHKMKKYNIQI